QSRVSSMFGARTPFPERRKPMPIRQEVSASNRGGAGEVMARLKAMTEPPSEVRERALHVRRPFGVQILRLDPLGEGRELAGGRPKGDAIVQVDSSVAEREQLRAKQVFSPEAHQDERISVEGTLKPELPPRGKNLQE